MLVRECVGGEHRILSLYLNCEQYGHIIWRRLLLASQFSKRTSPCHSHTERTAFQDIGRVFTVVLSETKAPNWCAHPSMREQVYKLSTQSAGTTVCEGVGGLEGEKSSVCSVGKPSGPIARSSIEIYGWSQRVRTCLDTYKCSTDISHKSLKSQQFMRLHLAQEEASQNLLQLCQWDHPPMQWGLPLPGTSRKHDYFLGNELQLHSSLLILRLKTIARWVQRCLKTELRLNFNPA